MKNSICNYGKSKILKPAINFSVLLALIAMGPWSSSRPSFILARYGYLALTSWPDNNHPVTLSL